VADNDYHVQMNVRMVNLLRQMYSHGPHLKNTPSQKKKKKAEVKLPIELHHLLKQITRANSKIRNKSQI
jgi:hypothetical protein